MAFRSNGPVMLALPPFRGLTRQLILAALGVYFVMLILQFASAGVASTLFGFFILQPSAALHRQIWEFITYPFIGTGLFSVAFALLSLWFFATQLESERGSRWLGELFLASTVGGGLLAALLTVAAGGRIPGLRVDGAAAGMWPFVLSTLVAYGYFHSEEEISFNFLFQLKAKYLAAIYVLFYVALGLISGGRFDVLAALCNALCAYIYLRIAPRRAVRVAASERWFGWRNSYYRAKRRRAAKKFTVYMRKQGKEVTFDESGRYTGEDDPAHPTDPNDRRWMN